MDVVRYAVLYCEQCVKCTLNKNLHYEYTKHTPPPRKGQVECFH